MRKIFITFVLLTSAVLAGANTVINVETAGTLKTLIGENKLTTTDLVVSGNLNGSDIQVIREMAGIMLSGGPSGGKLARLDMTDANIVAGGDYYMYDYNTYENFYTAHNELGKYMFYNCPALQSIVIPKSVTAIGVEAFSVCANLKDVSVPETNSAFYSIDGVLFGKLDARLIKYPQARTETEYSIPNGIRNIGYEAFSDCVALTKINFPGTIENIDGAAFSFCNGITVMELPASVKTIKASAFNYCKNLTAINVPTSCAAFVSEDGVLYNKTKTVLVRCPQKKTGSFTIADGITILGDYAFHGCLKLTKITLPTGLTTIGEWTFSSCKGLTSIDIPVSVANIGQGAFCDCTEIGSVAVPEGVTGIFKWTFYGCIKLLSVALPASLTELGEGAFMGCRELTELSVPENVTIVPPSAFGNCKKLRKLSLPKAITQIGHYAASGCAALEELYLYAENPPSCGFYPFNGVDKQKCKLYVPKDTKARYQSAGGFSDFNNIIEIETSGIAAILEDNNETVRYTIGGIPTKTPLKGINIVRTRDGKTRKIVVR